MPGTKNSRRRQRQYGAAFARYSPDRRAEPVELLDDNTLDAWLAAASHTGNWWAIPRAIRPQVRRRVTERRAG